MTECPGGKWLLLIHQIPPKPGYLRVKIWRRLQSLGAVAIKNSVYVIPKTDQTLEDFHWVLKEIVHAGAEASICTASFVEGLTDDQVEALFRTARDPEYRQIADEAEAVLDAAPPHAAMTDDDRSHLEASLARLRKRFSSVVNLDFFGAPGRETAAVFLERLESRLAEARKESKTRDPHTDKPDLSQVRGRTWVTRKGIHVDRMACAWLIRRLIDPDARFRFAAQKGTRVRPGELAFDMFEGDFTHEGDRCTFEVLVDRFFPADEALAHVGRIVHDLDLKDSKFNKPETPGIGALIAGICSVSKTDEVRLEQGSALFEQLYEYFRRK